MFNIGSKIKAPAIGPKSPAKAGGFGAAASKMGSASSGGMRAPMLTTRKPTPNLDRYKKFKSLTR